MTKSEQIIAALLKMGCKEVPSASKKYRKFTRPPLGAQDSFYFVGKAGALRAGDTSSDSVSLEHAVPALLKNWGLNHLRTN